MKNPEIKCSSCGGTHLKRSHSISLFDLPKMALGTYPFRCMECKARTWINVWSLAQRRGVICPRCLNSSVSPIDPERLKVGLWGMVRRAMGAQSYQCRFCNFRFLSSKGKTGEALPEDEAESSNQQPRQPEMRAASAGGSR